MNTELKQKVESLFAEYPWMADFFDQQELIKERAFETNIKYSRINHDFLLRHLNGSRYPVYDMPDMETIWLVDKDGEELGEVGWKLKGCGQIGLSRWKKFWENITNPFSSVIYIKGETVAQAIQRLGVVDKVCYAVSLDWIYLTVYKEAKFDLTGWFEENTK